MTGVKVAIVDYGFGNVRSVELACRRAGVEAAITSSDTVVAGADGVILPGIGAFGDAMDALHRLHLVDVLHDVAASGRPLMGVCLGAQLLLKASSEFGSHEGLGVIDGTVEPLAAPVDRRAKVPHVGWTAVEPARRWSETMLDRVRAGALMYFTHSFYLVPADAAVALSTSTYGGVTFCSSFQVGNVFGCQFHPERSGRSGLAVYESFVRSCTKTLQTLPTP